MVALEESSLSRGVEVEELQQAIIRLQDQQLVLQPHAEDVENRSRRNNICMRGVPTGAEGMDLEGYIQALFKKHCRRQLATSTKVDRCHRVCPQSITSPTCRYLLCIRTFTEKDAILRAARFDQTTVLLPLQIYQELVASTLLKRK